MQKNSEKHENDMQPKGRPVIIPYIYTVSHNLKSTPQKYNAHVVRSSANKLVSLCQKINCVHKECKQQ